MDTHELFMSCRRGDLSKLKYLIEQKELELNVRDKWDSTPLYYACLCGHKDVVQYLLENGARCEANTFDGERCLYGALNNEIRNLLKSFNMVSSKTLRRDLYEEFLRRLLEMGMHEDVIFHVHGERFPAHRGILSVRCQYFAESFRTRWKNRTDIVIKHKLVFPWAFRSLLQYIYTGRLETHIDCIEDCKRLARQCQLNDLIKAIEEAYNKQSSFEMQKPGVNITNILIERSEDSFDLQFDLGRLADLALPQELSTFIQGELPFEPEYASCYPDICFCVEGHLFHCHKVFFCGRSDYFKALLIDHFGESQVSENNIPQVTLNDITCDIFTQIMYYIYQDSCELSEDTVYEVLWYADLYMLQGLKRQCATCISKFINSNNVLQILRSARLFNQARLEDQCAEFIANNLENMVDREDFCQLVMEDASDIKGRQETDSIGIIDDIRFHITNFVQTYSEMEEANERLRLVDRMLENLNLDG
ncbi:ankyrin repeat and BTB/POZ domain-containing protein 1-like [Ostrea edulis]|uniref:ankyrin repeat and BTB/POZ domain-containing protein 1-like n=1 Tax=Ostrea edulis TaxID=37623 RepID=UPI002094F26C|nr:ankyrin repeat and BTB/POZ domain-containing protein 1-like [Ostrea edulis]